MFQNNPYYQQPQRGTYLPQQYQPLYQQPVQQPMMQDGMVQARFVSGREEAVAANVIPGSLCLFIDRANHKIYTKLIDPQTGMPDFKDFGEIQPEQPPQMQYVTVDDLVALEQRIEQRFAAMQSKPASRKVTNSDE